MQTFGRDFRLGAEQEDGDFDAGRCWWKYFRCSLIADRWVALRFGRSSVSRLVSAMGGRRRARRQPPSHASGVILSKARDQHVSDFGIVCGPSDSVRLAKSIFVNRFLKSLLLAFWSRFLDFYLSGNVFPMFGAVLIEF